MKTESPVFLEAKKGLLKTGNIFSYQYSLLDSGQTSNFSYVKLNSMN